MSMHNLPEPDDFRTRVRVYVADESPHTATFIEEDRRRNSNKVVFFGITHKGNHRAPVSLVKQSPLEQVRDLQGEPRNLTEYVAACPWPHNGESCGWCSI